jgi:hypothetical protein
MFVRPERSLIVRVLAVLWQLRTELVASVVGVWGWLWLTDRMPAWIAVTVVSVTIAALLGWGPSRRFALGHVWCTITRHRLRSCLVQSRVMNHCGYVPWLLWVRPTNVGERVWLLMRPGICVEDLDTRASQIAAACWARDARVRAWRRLVAVVLVDVVRRDPLTSGKLVGSPLPSLAGGSGPTALPGIPAEIGDDDGVDELGPRTVHDDGVEDWELGPDASGAVLAGSAHAPTLRVARGAQVHRPTAAKLPGTPVAAEPVVRPTGPGAVSSSGEDVSDYV